MAWPEECFWERWTYVHSDLPFEVSLSAIVMPTGFNYYEALTAKVLVSKSNLTKPFHYAISVFQGCVLSPALFNICFQPLLDTIGKVSISCGWSYTFKSDPTINCDVSAFADDLELCSWQPKLCQAQISICDRYLSWSRSMQARPNKCFSAAMRQSNSIGSSGVTGYDRFDPCLSIAGGRIQYLDDGDFKYLGRLLNTTASEITSRTQCKPNWRRFSPSLTNPCFLGPLDCGFTTILSCRNFQGLFWL